MTRADDAPGQPPLAFTLAKSGESIAMRDAVGEIATADLFAPLPLRSVSLDGADIAFAGRRCAAASGAVRVNIEQSLFGLTLQRGLSGNLRCHGADLLVPLKGQSGLEQLDISHPGHWPLFRRFPPGRSRGERRARAVRAGFPAAGRCDGDPDQRAVLNDE